MQFFGQEFVDPVSNTAQYLYYPKAESTNSCTKNYKCKCNLTDG